MTKAFTQPTCKAHFVALIDLILWANSQDGLQDPRPYTEKTWYWPELAEHAGYYGHLQSALYCLVKAVHGQGVADRMRAMDHLTPQAWIEALPEGTMENLLPLPFDGFDVLLRQTVAELSC